MPIRTLLTVFFAALMSFMLSSPLTYAELKEPCAKNPCAEMTKRIRKTPVKDAKSLRDEAIRLWKDTSLGRAGVSCSTCHPDGSGLKREPFPKYIKMADDIVTLDQMINFCMMNPMKGKPLSWNSVEMTALAAYVSDHAAGGEAINPCRMKK
ncbi:MAG: hypothetical protein HY887_03880 [Deltaproteobacteria bacterium]|nr:hypothetical protein [Deltaproteobacteria bacterium]